MTTKIDQLAELLGSGQKAAGIVKRTVETQLGQTFTHQAFIALVRAVEPPRTVERIVGVFQVQAQRYELATLLSLSPDEIDHYLEDVQTLVGQPVQIDQMLRVGQVMGARIHERSELQAYFALMTAAHTANLDDSAFHRFLEELAPYKPAHRPYRTLWEAWMAAPTIPPHSQDILSYYHLDQWIRSQPALPHPSTIVNAIRSKCRFPISPSDVLDALQAASQTYNMTQNEWIAYLQILHRLRADGASMTPVELLNVVRQRTNHAPATFVALAGAIRGLRAALCANIR